MNMRITRFTSAVAVSMLLVASSILAQDEAPMDHSAVAASYAQEAKAAEAKVASHELMLRRYQGMPMLPKGSGATKEQMVKHCQKLVDSYKEVAAQANDLAKEHRAMAQGVQ